MKIQQTILLFLVIFTVQSAFVDLDICINTCETSHCTGNSCDNVIDEFVTFILTFDEQICTDYLYTRATPTTNSELATQLAGCLDAHAATISGDKQALQQCVSDCVLAEDSEYDNFLFGQQIGDLKAAEICVIEIFQTSDQCKADSPCQIALKYDLRQLEIENQISDCEKMRQNYNLNDADKNELLSDCNSQLATIMTQKNIQTPNTYHSDLINITQGISDCISVENLNLVTIGDVDEEEEEDQIPNQDCKANFCLSEFNTCQGQCGQQCVTSDCFGDTTDGYISLYTESECQANLLHLNQLRKNKDYIDSTFQTTFVSCVEQLETTYASDSKVMGYLTCVKACKDKKPVEEEKEDSAQVMSFIGSCLILIFLII